MKGKIKDYELYYEEIKQPRRRMPRVVRSNRHRVIHTAVVLRYQNMTHHLKGDHMFALREKLMIKDCIVCGKKEDMELWQEQKMAVRQLLKLLALSTVKTSISTLVRLEAKLAAMVDSAQPNVVKTVSRVKRGRPSTAKKAAKSVKGKRQSNVTSI